VRQAPFYGSPLFLDKETFRLNDGSMSFFRSRPFVAVVMTLFAIGVLFFLVSVNLRTVINSGWLYSIGANNFNTLERTGMTKGEYLRVTKEIKRYFNSNEEPLQVKAVVFGSEEEIFTTREVRHMSDVKLMVRGLTKVQWYSFFYMLSLLVLGWFLWGRKALWARIAKGLMWGSVLTIATLAIVGLASLIGFDTAFIWFHEIAFENNRWLLNKNDYLLRMFPENFFLTATLIVAGMTVAQALITGVVAWLFLRRDRKRVPAAPPAGN
jgi:integral membrane protein (TIGR01906 family)